MLNLKKQLQIHDLNLSDDLRELKQFAEKKSALCGKYIAAYGQPDAVKFCSELFNHYNLSLPDSSSEQEFLNKAACPRVWFLRIKKLAAKTIEHVQRQCSLVNQQNGSYCSDNALRNWEWQQAMSLAYMESTFIENADGQSFSLKEVAEHTVSNPHVRRCEMMVRIRGFEEVAQHMGHVGDFYTITVPSRMHSHRTNGQPNPKYDGTTTKEANDYLCNVWQRIRAKLDRNTLRVYGVRVTEPHHDGSPHWHLMLFMHPDEQTQIRAIIKAYALAEDSNETGAKAYRYKCVGIDPSKGDAAGYVAKYVAKNIDGEYLSHDTYGNESKVTARRIRSWASLNSIRQFQFIGGPSVTLWRELRKLDESDCNQLEQIRKHADSSDWAAYVIAMGGTHIPRDNRPLALEYSSKPEEIIDYDTGEITHTCNRYGGLPFPKLAGFRLANKFIPIQKQHWTLKPSPPS